MGGLFLKLLNMSVTAGWLILAVVLLRPLLNKAPKAIRCVLWGLVGLRLVVPVSIQSRWSLIPDTQPVTGGVMEMPVTPDVLVGTPGVNIPNQGVIQTPVATPDVSAAAVVNAADIAAVVWLMGMAALLVYALISYARLCRRVSAALLLGDNIYLCDEIGSPFILGILRPRIYLPSSIGQGEMVHVLAHEQAHLRRRDHWWKPLGFTLLAVYWFNPLIWLAYVLLCRDIELACDEKVVRRTGIDRAAYSQALLNCSMPRRMIAACPLAFGELGVKARIRSVLNYKKPAFWIVLVAMLACIAAAVLFLTDPVEPTVDDIIGQNGYRVEKLVTNRALEVKLEQESWPESVWSVEGAQFKQGDITVYESDTTAISLVKAGYLDENGEWMSFLFEMSYEPTDSGSVTLLYTPVYEEGEQVSSRFGLSVPTRTAKTLNRAYSDAAYLRGENGGLQFEVCVKSEVFRAENSQTVRFYVLGFTDVLYEKGDPNRDAMTIQQNGWVGETEEDNLFIPSDATVVSQWVDYYSSKGDMPWDESMECQLPEFPGVTFRWTAEEVTAVDDDGEETLFQGMPVWSVYLADLNGDGCREFCSTISIGSGIVDDRVVVYDYATQMCYELSARGEYNYVLSKDVFGRLRVKQYAYLDYAIMSSGDLALNQEGELYLANLAVPMITGGESDQLHQAIDAAVGEYYAADQPNGLLRARHYDILDKQIEGETVQVWALTMCNGYRLVSGFSEKPVPMESKSALLLMSFRQEEDGGYTLDFCTDAFLLGSLPPEEVQAQANDETCLQRLDEECDRQAEQFLLNMSGQIGMEG